MKRWLEDISNSIGYDGEINDEVIRVADKLGFKKNPTKEELEKASQDKNKDDN